MKKLALLLAMLMCMVPVLTACGANSSPEKAVEAAIDVMYGDGDADPDDYWAVVYTYNLDVADLLDSDSVSDIKEGIRASQKEMKDSLNRLEDMDKQAEEAELDDWSFTYEILYCNTYEDGDIFDSIMADFGYVDTAVEDYVDEVAKVGVLMTYESEKDGEVSTSVNTQVFTCYRIDGDWYIED